MSVTEQWRPIPGFPGYDASSEGEIRSCRCVLRQSKHTHGYRMVSPCVNGKNKPTLVHRLVAVAFLGPIPDGQEVNHLDGNKANNRASNLEYVTRKGNMAHAQRIGIWDNRGELNGQATVTQDQILLAYRMVESGITRKDAAAAVGIPRDLLNKVTAGTKWKHLNLAPIKRRKGRLRDAAR